MPRCDPCSIYDDESDGLGHRCCPSSGSVRPLTLGLLILALIVLGAAPTARALIAALRATFGRLDLLGRLYFFLVGGHRGVTVFVSGAVIFVGLVVRFVRLRVLRGRVIVAGLVLIVVVLVDGAWILGFIFGWVF